MGCLGGFEVKLDPVGLKLMEDLDVSTEAVGVRGLK